MKKELTMRTTIADKIPGLSVRYFLAFLVGISFAGVSNASADSSKFIPIEDLLSKSLVAEAAFNEGAQIIIITGPMNAGKTTVARLLGEQMRTAGYGCFWWTSSLTPNDIHSRNPTILNIKPFGVFGENSGSLADQFTRLCATEDGKLLCFLFDESQWLTKNNIEDIDHLTRAHPNVKVVIAGLDRIHTGEIWPAHYQIVQTFPQASTIKLEAICESCGIPHATYSARFHSDTNERSVPDEPDTAVEGKCPYWYAPLCESCFKRNAPLTPR
jgi:thymidine kinase